jgi:hypothetical protein
MIRDVMFASLMLAGASVVWHVSAKALWHRPKPLSSVIFTALCARRCTAKPRQYTVNLSCFERDHLPPHFGSVTRNLPRHTF